MYMDDEFVIIDSFTFPFHRINFDKAYKNL